MFARLFLALLALSTHATSMARAADVAATAPTTVPATRPLGAAPPPDAHVVLIAIDGFPAYLFNDPESKIPTLRKLAADGAVADGMTVVNPSVTWPNHTTLVTGVYPAKHGVLFNGVLTRPGDGRAVRVDPARDKADLVAVPTLFDVLFNAGQSTAAINWPCTRNAASIEDNTPDVPEHMRFTTPRLLEELVASGAMSEGTDAHFATLKGADRDKVWGAAACTVIRRRKPNFLSYHILLCDSAHHRYGPKSPEGYEAIAIADGLVADVLKALDDAGIRQKTTLLVTSDHGFARAEKLIAPNVLFRNAGLLRLTPTAGIARAKAQIVSEGGTAMLYFPEKETAAEDKAKALELLSGAEGIAQIVEPKDFAARGLPDPTKNPQMADLILVAKDGYAFSGAATTEYAVETSAKAGSMGHHGFPSDLDRMQALFIASGRGIRQGAKLGVIRNVDVAPTIANLLGKQLADVDGKPMANLLIESGNDAPKPGAERSDAPDAPRKTVTTAPAAAAPWQPLFNGKDLSNWDQIGSAVWRVENGVILGGQDGDPKRSGLLATKGQFQDFELQLDFMIDEHGKYNSGVYLRNAPGQGGRTGYQVNIGRGEAGEYCGGLHLADWVAKGDEKDAVRKKGEWNTLRIVAVGGHFVVDLNGVNVVDHTVASPDPKHLQPGTIAFQTYGAEGHAGWVKFRDVKIRPAFTGEASQKT